MFKKSIFFVCCIVLFYGCETNQDNSNSTLEAFNTIPRGNEFVKANNTFAFDIFKNILSNEDKENVMISPVSLSLALGMTYNGAENETKSAFEKTLNYTNFTREGTNAINKEIISNLSENSNGTLFEIANSIWVDNLFPVKENFIDVNKNNYKAEVESLNFSDANSVDIINNWVSDKTYQKIPKIIERIRPEEVMFLINALYFKSDWKYGFDKEKTQEMPFYGDNGIENVATMQLTDSLSFYENNALSMVKLPYKNDKYSMTILLPKGDKEIADLTNNLTNDNWTDWNQNISKEKVSLSMPKFKFSYQKQLNNPLSDLGLGIAFSNGADFNGISDVAVSISYVLQKTFIEVEEEGIESAAVTSVGIGTTSIAPQNKQVSLNRPFLFTITEKETGSICFLGKIGMPQYEN